MRTIKNLRHVLSDIKGHFILGYGDAEDKPDKPIELREEAAEQAERFLSQHPDTHQRFEQVVNLIEGFETTFGMELLATVHWVATREGATTVEEAVAQTYAWNERKRIFKPEHVRVAFEVLDRKGWLLKADAQLGLSG